MEIYYRFFDIFVNLLIGYLSLEWEVIDTIDKMIMNKND